MEHPDRAALEALALRWIGARLFEGERPLGEQGLPRAVPPELAALVAPGPARARTLDDAARWLGWPKPFGLGLACDLVNADAITLAAGGERAPSATKRRTMPSPKPEPPPVTMADLPCNRICVSWLLRTQSCRIATVLSAEKPYSASKPFSRPWPESLMPPNGSSIPPAAP